MDVSMLDFATKTPVVIFKMPLLSLRGGPSKTNSTSIGFEGLKPHIKLINSMFLGKYVRKTTSNMTLSVLRSPPTTSTVKHFHYRKYGLSTHTRHDSKSNSKLNMYCQHRDKLLVVFSQDLYKTPFPCFLLRLVNNQRRGSWQPHSGERRGCLSIHPVKLSESFCVVCVCVCVVQQQPATSSSAKATGCVYSSFHTQIVRVMNITLTTLLH